MDSSDLYKAIFKRKSIRTYSATNIPEDEYQKLNVFFDRISIGPMGSKIHLFRTKEFSGLSKIGTYGVIKGGNDFLAFYADKNNFNWLDIGYVIEKTILYLTSRGIGTCWIGGTFHRNKILSGLTNQNNIILPIITPIGYASQKRSNTDKLLRFAAKADKRKPLDEIIIDSDFNSVLSNDLYLKVSESIRLAPSASNKQPWRISFRNNSINLFINRTKNYHKLIPSIDLQLIDIGIALSHLTLSLEKHNVNFNIEKNNKITDNNYIISCILINA